MKSCAAVEFGYLYGMIGYCLKYDTETILYSCWLSYKHKDLHQNCVLKLSFLRWLIAESDSQLVKLLWVPELVRLENLGKRLNNQLIIILQIETLTDYNVEFVKCELNQQLAGQRLKSDHPSKLWYSTASHGLIWSIEEAELDHFSGWYQHWYLGI